MAIDVATGAVELSAKDILIPGRVPLSWGRTFSSALISESDSPLGPGWTNPCFAKLTRIGKEYRFRGPTGAVIAFPDPGDTVEREGIIRDLGSFHEISRHGLLLQVTHWTAIGTSARYLFQPERNGLWWPLRSLEDAAGNGLELAWDDQGRLKGLRQKHEKRTLTVAYSQAGRVASVAFRHADGRLQTLVQYGYDPQGRLTSIQDALGHKDRYEYDRAGRISREIAKDGGIFTFKYDDQGRCIRTHGLDNYDLKVLRYLDHIQWTEVTDSLGKTNRYQWLASGQVVLEIDPLGAKTETAYDDLGRVVSKTGPMGETSRFEYDGNGNRCKVIDAMSGETTFGFDAKHLLISQTDANGGVWTRDYDAFNRPVAATDPSGSKAEIEYDRSGNPVQLKNASGAVGKRVYAENGDLISETDWAGGLTTYVRDEFGRILKRRDPDGKTTAHRYDPLGRIIHSAFDSGKTIQYEYDVAGNILRVVSSTEAPVSFRYGTCRRVIEKKYGAGQTVRYAWGSEPDRLESVTNELGEVYRYGYDARGRVVSETGFDGRKTSFKFNLSGGCVGTTNNIGESIVWELDPLGRIVGETLKDEAPSSFKFDKLGNLLSAVNSWGAIEFERDAVGRVIKETQGGFGIERRYGPMGEVLRLESDAGIHFEYAYDGNGLAAAVNANGLGAFTFRRNAAGNPESIDMPGGLKLEQTFDSRRLLLKQTVSGPESDLQGAGIVDREYAYDDSNLLLSVLDGKWGKSRYAHDESKRLIRFASGPVRTEYRLNATGDAVMAIENGEAEIPRTYDPGGMLVRQGDIEYEYDGAGRLISKSGGKGSDPARKWKYRWDAKDRLRSLENPDGEKWEYQYDPLGRRCLKKGPDRETRFVWDRDVLLHEMEGKNPAITWGFEPESFKPLFKLHNGSLFPIIRDQIGTPREMLDARGKVVWSMHFDPWGNPIEGKGRPEDCPFRFQGQYSDAESGLHYNRYRYYDPVPGRFISKDPIRLGGGMSAYQYVPNPVNWIDPLGLCGDEDDAAAGEPEILYRAMKEKHYKRFLKDGKIPATGETFTSQSEAESKGYRGVLVKLELKPGTIAKLEGIGVRENQPLTAAKYPEMPLMSDTRNWTANNAYFKEENDQINIGLGKGKALDTVNDNITGHSVVPR
ncbi:MAG TPA: RHS repeat-associated core domain-containing protein [Fibrobacteria bacterium]|nr:RHS repeat-associated core domain-containing protein [Fibrobacteria bacterium]